MINELARAGSLAGIFCALEDIGLGVRGQHHLSMLCPHRSGLRSRKARLAKSCLAGVGGGVVKGTLGRASIRAPGERLELVFFSSVPCWITVLSLLLGWFWTWRHSCGGEGAASSQAGSPGGQGLTRVLPQLQPLPWTVWAVQGQDGPGLLCAKQSARLRPPSSSRGRAGRRGIIVFKL